MRLLVLVIAGVLFLASCKRDVDEDPCAVVAFGGACVSDSDCVNATCAAACCGGGTNQCGEGNVYSRARLAEHLCLTEQGKTADPACESPVDCLCPTCAAPPLLPRCLDGGCIGVVRDGGA